MKPIEPGCRALVTWAVPFYADVIGTEVKVIGHQLDGGGDCARCGSSREWPVSHPINGEADTCGCSLMRIDGDDEQFRREELERQGVEFVEAI